MADLCPVERPRERILASGSGALSLTELLAVLLGGGTTGRSALTVAQQIVTLAGSAEGLARLSLDDLLDQCGVGPARAARLMAALEVGKRVALSTVPNRLVVDSAAKAAAILSERLGELDQEELHVLLLDGRSRLVRSVCVYRGTPTSITVRPADVLRPAIRAGAMAILVAHNHPSGDPTPSDEDIELTRHLRRAAQLIGIDLIDHLILVAGGHLSLRHRGLGFD